MEESVKTSQAVKSPLELALEDVKHGRVTRIKNIDNFKDECLQSPGSHAYVLGL